MKGYFHTPVMVREVINYLRCSKGGTFVDATVGEGGHALELLRTSQYTRLVGVDWDAEILDRARERLARYAERVVLIHDNFTRLPQILGSLGIGEVDGILFDFGVSQFHLAHGERGFSLHHDAPLDMRMDTSRKLTAYEIVNYYPIQEIEGILRDYGEERWAKRIAQAIGERRRGKRIQTTGELARICADAIPQHHLPRRIHPATKTFMALRIAVNEELRNIKEALATAPLLLRQKGRIACISFHSLEDRIVKEAFKEQAKMGKALWIITKHPITPAFEEVRENPRARSAKLRVAERL